MFINDYNNRKNNIILSGAITEEYKIRANLKSMKNNNEDFNKLIYHLPHLTYDYTKNNEDTKMNYYNILSQYKGAFVGHPIFPLAKHIEVLMCGCLGFFERNKLLKTELGLIEYVHYIPCSDDNGNLIEDIQFYTDWLNKGETIANNGKKYVIKHFGEHNINKYINIFTSMINKKINNIKIFGERNSGTTFLKKLLVYNICNTNIYSYKCNEGTGWKHGFPKIELFNNINKTLFIFIIRDFDSWIKSMFMNPYHYEKSEDINIFIKEKLKCNEKNIVHDTNIYELEKQDIISLRYSKINSYLEFYDKINNGIIISLDYLQNNDEDFIKFLNKNYGIEINDNFTKVINHTKNKNLLNVCNREYDIIIPDDINKDINIESFVEGLNKKIMYK